MAPEELIAEAEAFLTAFYSMFKTRHLYPPTHRRFTKSLEPVQDSLSRLLGKNPEEVFIIVEREFIFEGAPLFRSMTGMRDFADVFERHGIDRLTIQQGIGMEELINLVNILTMRQSEIDEQGGMEELLGKEQMPHARLERLSLGKKAQEILTGQAQYQQSGADGAAGFAPYAYLYKKTESLFDLMYQSREADIVPAFHEALDALEGDEVVCDALGETLTQEFLRLKRAEWVEWPASAIDDAAEQRITDRDEFGAVDRAPPGERRQANLRRSAGRFERDDAGTRRQTIDVFVRHQEQALAVEADHFRFDR